MKHFKPGDRVVYLKTKRSEHPGMRAREIYPAEHGDGYAYQVDKYWLVVGREDEETVALITRTGKRHAIREDDPCLRKASLLQRLLYGHRFPKLPVE